MSIIKTNKYNILLAEDNEANQALIERMLVNGGHTVTVVANGQEALDELCLSQYELCIIDIQMPVMDGFETITLFRKSYPQSKLAFITLTADESEETLAKCEQAGALYLSKPVRSEALLKAINNVFENQNKNQKETEKKIIDISNFDYFNDQVFLDKFIELFEKSCEKLTRCLKQACNEDFTEFKKVVHTIKGLSGNIHAEALRDITIEAENLNEEDYATKADEYFNKISHELARAREELLKLSSRGTEKSNEN